MKKILIYWKNCRLYFLLWLIVVALNITSLIKDIENLALAGSDRQCSSRKPTNPTSATNVVCHSHTQIYGAPEGT